MEKGIADIRSWMISDKLISNDDKTEFWTIATDITKTCGSAFFYLYNIRHIRKYLTSECTEKLIHAFITSRLDYCNSLLYMMEFPTIICKNSNARAPLIFCPPKHCHITPLLRQLHQLPIRLWIEFKMLLITFKVLLGPGPKYRIDLIYVLPPSRYNLRRNNTGILLSTPKCFKTVTMGDLSFMAEAPQLWNSLPADIRSACRRHFYCARHFVTTISFDSFSANYFLISNCQQHSFRLLIPSNCKCFFQFESIVMSVMRI